MAADAGVDIVDTAISSMSSLTSQPSMNSLVTALEGSDRETGFDPRQLQKLSDYWEDTRKYYSGFEGDIKVPETEILSLIHILPERVPDFMVLQFPLSVFFKNAAVFGQFSVKTKIFCKNALFILQNMI